MPPDFESSIAEVGILRRIITLDITKIRYYLKEIPATQGLFEDTSALSKIAHSRWKRYRTLTLPPSSDF